jgi:peptide/nickel transport system substrate-binding protein
MMRHAQTWIRRAALALVLSVVAAACGDREDGADGKAGAPKGGTGNQPTRGGRAVIAEPADLKRPLPLLWEGDLDSDLVDMMYMALTRSTWGDGEIRYLTSHDSPMALAWHYEYTGPDSSALRYRMRSDLKWSDGQPITAHDVAWTYRMYADRELASPRMGDVEPIDSVVAENDSTVVFHFDRRSPEMLFQSGLAITPRHVYQGVAPARIRTHASMNDPAKGLVVSGPFRIGAWAPNQRVTLVANPHFSVQPRLDEIVIRIVPEPTSRIVELQTGNADFVRQISFDQVPRLRQQAPDVRFEKIGKRFFEYVAYNPKAHPAFADPEIRRALGLAVNVPGLIQALQMQEFTAPAGGPYPPILKSVYDPRRMGPLPHDPERAKQILESKGWRDTDGDGIREKDGRPLRFSLVTNSGNQRRSDVSQILQQQWKQVGVDARLQTLEFNTFMERQFAEEYEALLGGWGVNLNPDLFPLWGKDAALNVVSYDNPEAFRMMESARSQPTQRAAAPYWQAAAERIVQDQPYTFLYYYDVLVGVNNRLKGVKIDSYGAYQNTWEWWVQGDPRRGGAAAPPADTSAG